MIERKVKEKTIPENWDNVDDWLLSRLVLTLRELHDCFW